MINFPDSPTYFPPQSNRTTPSTIDFFLSNGFFDATDIETVNELSSDHLPVSFVLELSNPIKTIASKSKCYAKADWGKYKSYLNERIDLLLVAGQLESKADVDTSITALTRLMKEAEDVSIPMTKKITRFPSISASISRLIAIRNLKRRQWQRSRHPTLKEEVNSLNRQIKTEVKLHNNLIWNEKLSRLNSHPNQFWKVTKTLKNPVTKIPPLKTSSTLLFTDSQKADEIGSAFCGAHSTTFNESSDDVTESAVTMSNNSINFFKPVIQESCLPTPREISRLIRRLKSKKSPGDDGISNILLKKLPKKAIILTMHIFRACFRLS